MNRDREHQNFYNGKMLMCWLLHIFLRMSLLLFWCYQIQQLLIAFHSSVCWHSSLQMRLSPMLYHPSLSGILCKPHCYCHVCRNFPPIFRYMPRSLLKACIKKLFKSWSSCFQSGSNCLYKWLIIQVSMIEYFFPFSSLFSAFRDWKQPWPSSTLR